MADLFYFRCTKCRRYSVRRTPGGHVCSKGRPRCGAPLGYLGKNLKLEQVP